MGQVFNLPRKGRQVENLPHGKALSSVVDFDALRRSTFNQLDRLSDPAEIVVSQADSLILCAGDLQEYFGSLDRHTSSDQSLAYVSEPKRRFTFLGNRRFERVDRQAGDVTRSPSRGPHRHLLSNQEDEEIAGPMVANHSRESKQSRRSFAPMGTACIASMSCHPS